MASFLGESDWVKVPILMLLVILKPSIITAQDLPMYRAIPSTSSVMIDGVLDEKLWVSAPKSEDFVGLEHCHDQEEMTSFQVGYDDKYLYMAVTAYDTDITASITQDNEPLYKYDSTIEIFIDPKSDGKDYYEFQVNPHNAKWQLSLTKPHSQGGNATDPAMIEGLMSAVHINGSLNDTMDTDQSWTVEVAIPWEQLEELTKTENIVNQELRINVGRVAHDKVTSQANYAVWSCAEAFSMHMPERWGWLYFQK